MNDYARLPEICICQIYHGSGEVIQLGIGNITNDIQAGLYIATEQPDVGSGPEVPEPGLPQYLANPRLRWADQTCEG